MTEVVSYLWLPAIVLGWLGGSMVVAWRLGEHPADGLFIGYTVGVLMFLLGALAVLGNLLLNLLLR